MTFVSTGQESSKSRLVLLQGMTQEFAHIKQKEGVYLNYRKIETVNPETAKTLCARDFKGFGTGWDTMNGVIEIENRTTSK